MRLDNGYISFGSKANCTLEVCPLESSILEYQPSKPGNYAFIALFALSMIIHVVQGIRWKAWDFMICIAIGCLDEIIGYAGRIMLNPNPFSYSGFIIQTVCITTAPVFFCSAIYVQLSRTINQLDRSIARFNPAILIWTFIPCDILSLILQAAGGALSATQAGTNNKSGVRISQVGLILQVVTLVIFCVLFADYVLRYNRRSRNGNLSSRVKVFLTFLALSIVLVLVRCAYRIDELSDGYDGDLIHDEKLFMILEGGMMILAVFCLNIAHPGIAFGSESARGDYKPGLSQTPTEEVVTMAQPKSAQQYSYGA